MLKCTVNTLMDFTAQFRSRNETAVAFLKDNHSIKYFHFLFRLCSYIAEFTVQRRIRVWLGS